MLLCALLGHKRCSWAQTLQDSSLSIRERSSCKVILILGQLEKGPLEAEQPLPRTRRAKRTQRGHCCHNQPPAHTTALLRTKAASSHLLWHPRHSSFSVRGGSPSGRKADSNMGTGTSCSCPRAHQDTARPLHGSQARAQSQLTPPSRTGFKCPFLKSIIYKP